jgi:hypothetical protein
MNKYKILVITCLLFSCKKEKEIILEPTVFQIEPNYRIYFSNFIFEARLRGITIDTTNLIIRTAKNSANLKETCGTCAQDLNNKKIQKIIEINALNDFCWGKTNYLAKEALIFHELGHCILGRINHKNELFANKSPKSIMISDDRDLYIPCNYQIDDDTDCNKTNRRKYYLDELFDPKTTIPNWAK